MPQVTLNVCDDARRSAENRKMHKEQGGKRRDGGSRMYVIGGNRLVKSACVGRSGSQPRRENKRGGKELRPKKGGRREIQLSTKTVGPPLASIRTATRVLENQLVGEESEGGGVYQGAQNRTQCSHTNLGKGRQSPQRGVGTILANALGA